MKNSGKYRKMKNQSFNKLFTLRELSEIRGARNRNYMILISILIGTFAAVTIADGGLDYLRYKMRDPFVKNLEVTIPYEQVNNVDTYKYFLNQDSLKKRFHYDTVMSHVEMSLLMWSEPESEYVREKGRSIEDQNPILEKILERSNLIRGRGFQDQFDIGFIVTRQLLQDLGYPLDAHFIHMAVPRTTEGYFKVPVPVIAVVKEIPGLASFAFTPYFYKTRNLRSNNPFFLDRYSDINYFMPETDPDRVAEVKDILREIMENNELFAGMDPSVEQFGFDFSHKPGTRFAINFYPQPYDEEELEMLVQELTGTEAFGKIGEKLQRCYYYNMPPSPDYTIDYDRMSFLFSSLRQVGEFKEYLYNKHQLEVEMSKIRDKENFRAISILTISMTIILLIFSVFSVALFIFNLLKNHLLKIRMNLGTFKAFGMSNHEIKVIYKGIIRRFCLSGIGISLAVVFVIDVLVVLIFLRELHILHMLNIYTLIAVAAIIASVEWTVKKSSDAILENTPGDLIYGRDNN